MTEQTPYQQLRQLEFIVKRLAISSDEDDPGSAGRKALDKLKRDVKTAVDTLKDYEMFQLEEDLRKQANVLPKAVKSLERTRESLLKVSEYGLVSAVDVAQISAQLDELIDRLR